MGGIGIGIECGCSSSGIGARDGIGEGVNAIAIGDITLLSCKVFRRVPGEGIGIGGTVLGSNSEVLGRGRCYGINLRKAHKRFLRNIPYTVPGSEKDIIRSFLKEGVVEGFVHSIFSIVGKEVGLVLGACVRISIPGAILSYLVLEACYLRMFVSGLTGTSYRPGKSKVFGRDKVCGKGEVARIGRRSVVKKKGERSRRTIIDIPSFVYGFDIEVVRIFGTCKPRSASETYCGKVYGVSKDEEGTT